MIYLRLVRTGIENQADERSLQREIPLPGLANTCSQLTVPLLAHNQLLGVLCLQSKQAGRFAAVDERLVLVAARQIAATMAMIRLEARDPEEYRRDHPTIAIQTSPCSVIKHFGSDDSVFIDNAYLVEGVPGHILRKIACAYLSEGRSEFSNKEIRLDSSLQLPDFKDNLETRLILLRHRIEERCDFLQIVPLGRGRFRFDVKRRLKLEVPAIKRDRLTNLASRSQTLRFSPRPVFTAITRVQKANFAHLFFRIAVPPRIRASGQRVAL